MASELKVDKFTGVTTADSISVTTGATTTVLQKGMLKVTLHLNSMTSTPTQSEVLNVSSVDDDGTGAFGIHFSSNFNTANYIMTHAVNEGGASTAQFATDIVYGTNTTATTDIENHYVTATQNRTNADSYGIMLMFAGDLA